MYSLIIFIYSLLVKLAIPFNRKARMMVVGHWRTYNSLKQHIDPSARYIWFHAASLGEFEQGRPMIERIREQYPEYKILLTFFSPSGYEVRKNYPVADIVCYLPFDTILKVRWFLDTVKPEKAFFIKYEFWANYLSELHRRNVPTYLISGIFRPTQYFFKWYGKPFRNVLSYFTHLYVQDERSQNLLKTIGINSTTVCGDTRFDRVWEVYNQRKNIPSIDRFVEKWHQEGAKIQVIGSSWPKDEEILIDYFNTHSDLRLIIAPHEINKEHLLYILSLLKKSAIRLSEVTEADYSFRQCVIVDSFGLLSSIYRYCDLAYIGGGFGVGIHNVPEAAVYGIPVIFGPKYEKFIEAKELVRLQGARSIASKEEYEELMDTLLQNPDQIKAMGTIAGKFIEDRIGATDKILSSLEF